MSARIDIDAEPAQSTEIAKVYEWEGKPLLPFSAGRHCALQRIKVIGGSEMEAASAMVRLCQMQPAEVAAIRGERVAEFHAELADWMDRNGIGLGTKCKDNTAAILSLYGRILADLYEVERLVPETTGAPPQGGNG